MLRKTMRAEGPIAARALNLRLAHDSGLFFTGGRETEAVMNGGLLTFF
jgi:hypothetical protein